MNASKLKRLVIIPGISGLILAVFYFLFFVSDFSEAFNPPSGPAGSGSGAIATDASKSVGVGTSSVTTITNSKAKLLVVGSTTDATSFGFKVNNSGNLPVLWARNDGRVSVNTSSFPHTFTVDGTALITSSTYIGGNLNVSGTIFGIVNSTIRAEDIIPGRFAFSTGGGGGNFSFPLTGSVGIATTTNVSLPQPLSVYGNAYVSGNVGIGTTAPAAKLHVVGSTSGASALLPGGTTLVVRNDDLPGQDAIIALIGGSGVGGGTAGIYFGNAANPPQAVILHNNDNSSFQIGTNNVWRATFDSSGRLGIATTSPSYQLDIGTGDINVQSGAYRRGGTLGTSTTCIAGQVLDAAVVRGGIVTAGTCTAPSFSGPVQAANVASGTFGANTGGGNYSFLSTSNVGIGTTAPGEKLEVAGVSYANKAIEDSAGTGFIWDAAGLKRAGLIKQSGRDPEIRYLNSIGLSFKRIPSANGLLNDAGSDVPLFLSAAGNVGVAATAPAYKLDVGSGDINVQSGVYRKNGIAGANTTCAFGEVLVQPVVSGGIVTEGTCGTAFAGSVQASNVSVGTFGDSFGGGDYAFRDNTPARNTIDIQPSLYKILISNKTGGVTSSLKIAQFLGLTHSVEIGVGNGNPFIDSIASGAANSLDIMRKGAFTARFASNGNVGIGTTAPQNKLDVSGSAVIGSLYAGVSTAPANGLLVQGNVGIGNASPQSLLQVGIVALSGGSQYFQPPVLRSGTPPSVDCDAILEFGRMMVRVDDTLNNNQLYICGVSSAGVIGWRTISF